MRRTIIREYEGDKLVRETVIERDEEPVVVPAAPLPPFGGCSARGAPCNCTGACRGAKPPYGASSIWRYDPNAKLAYGSSSNQPYPPSASPPYFHTACQ